MKFKIDVFSDEGESVWERLIEADDNSEAIAEGTKQFQLANPDLDLKDHHVHASGPA